MQTLSDVQISAKPERKPAFRTSYGPVWIVRSTREIDPEVRERAFAHHCKDLRYYEVIERTLSAQFDQRYFVIEDEASGEVRVQPFFFVNQDLTAGLPGRFRTVVERLRARWPRFLNLRMLMVGCASAEGQLDCNEEWFVNALHEALDLFAPQSGASIILLKDFPRQYREHLLPFSTNGYRRVPSMPAAQLDLDFDTFEDFMAVRLGKVFRKNLRRKFKALRDAPPIEMEVVSDGAPFAEELYRLYRQTFERSQFHFEELTPDYFRTIGREMPDRIRFFIWRQSGRIVAFNLCMLHEGTLYDLDVGMDYSVALDLHLYFVTWRDMIEWSLRNDVKRYHTGPLNYDPKLHLRMQLAPQDLYARHCSPLLNPIFKLAMQFLEPTRHDPTLSRFPNAHELH